MVRKNSSREINLILGDINTLLFCSGYKYRLTTDSDFAILYTQSTVTYANTPIRILESAKDALTYLAGYKQALTFNPS